MGGPSVELLELSLDRADLELEYAQSKHTIELLGKDEDIRRLRAQLFLTEDDVDELRDQIQHEQASAQRFTQLVDEHLVRAQAAEAALEAREQDYSRREHAIVQLQAEVQSLKDTTNDVNMVLAEKLALSRELSIIKPELEHLRAQEGAMEQLRSDKLSLQRQLSEVQCELESARSEAKRAQAKRRNTTMEIAQEEQVAELKKELARERRLRSNAEQSAKEAQVDMKADDVRKQLAKEKDLREKLEQELESLRENTEIDEVRRELIKTQKAKLRLRSDLDNLQVELEQERATADLANKRAISEADDEAALTALREQLAQEKEARLSAANAATQKEAQLESEKAELEDKLNQFRSKLREKKEEVKTLRAEVATIKEQAEVSVKPVADLAPIKTLVRKPAAVRQNAVTISADETQLGTPGDGPKTRRGRQVKPVAVGEKSAFSITPFLNKTAVLDADMEGDNSVLDTSPTADKQVSKTPLAPAASIKGNRKPRSTAKTTKPVLTTLAEVQEPVSQEHTASPVGEIKTAAMETVEEGKANAEPATIAQQANPVQKRRQKLRKSLTDFQSFQTEDEPVKQKKRKLGARAPTLFDDDEVTVSNKTGGLFGAAAYAKLAASTKKPPLSVKGRSTLLTATDGSGFQFSPLRRTKKNLDETLRA